MRYDAYEWCSAVHLSVRFFTNYFTNFFSHVAKCSACSACSVLSGSHYSAYEYACLTQLGMQYRQCERNLYNKCHDDKSFNKFRSLSPLMLSPVINLDYIAD